MQYSNISIDQGSDVDVDCGDHFIDCIFDAIGFGGSANNVTFERCIFVDCDFFASFGSANSYIDCHFSRGAVYDDEADTTSVTVSGCRFEEVNLSGVTFDFDLTSCMFADCDLTGCDFSECP